MYPSKEGSGLGAKRAKRKTRERQRPGRPQGELQRCGTISQGRVTRHGGWNNSICRPPATRAPVLATLVPVTPEKSWGPFACAPTKRLGNVNAMISLVRLLFQSPTSAHPESVYSVSPPAQGRSNQLAPGARREPGQIPVYRDMVIEGLARLDTRGPSGHNGPKGVKGGQVRGGLPAAFAAPNAKSLVA